jgi:signal transduction histidine kinase/DNA-binding NarL/FixJ family response regulator
VPGYVTAGPVPAHSVDEDITMTTPKPIKVLHIDDDAGFLEMFRNTYGDLFEIVSLNGGDDVPKIVSREMPDALVLDFELPGRNGLELLAAIKDKHPSMPVIFYTGQGNEEIARQAFREGATDYFVKRTSDFAQKEKLVNSIRKALEKQAVDVELQEKQAMLEGIIENNPYSIQVWDSEGRSLRSNRAMAKIFGSAPLPKDVLFDESLTISQDVKDAIRKDWMERVKSYSVFNDKTAAKGDETGELIPLWKKGEVIKIPPFWYTIPIPILGAICKPKCVSTTGFSVKNQSGLIKYYVSMHEDITARIEAEEALRNAHQDLTEAHDALRAAYESVEQKVTERTAELEEANRKLQAEIEERTRLQIELEKQNTELESFSHTVSHDLRNNLLVMQKLMERDNIAMDDRQKTQELLMNNTAHLQQFVERLLFLAQAGRTIAEKRAASLDEAARKVFSMTAASHSDAELCVDSPFPAVHCDPGAFEQIFSNLFNNALTHSNPDTKPVIKIGCAINDGTAVITVCDNGKGITPEIVTKIFDSTFTTNRKEHFGLGLAIVKKLVEAHGGTIRAESEGPGKGASFIMTIPNG